MEMKQFQAESKRLLDMMINSIYTHKEIFLRELISNASDAIDKLYYRALQDGDTGLNRDDFSITLAVDKDKRTLTISDNGIGMTRDELDNNLGVIAKSGSLNFKQENEKKEDIDIIGQFGVGFYSAFMVSDDVTVDSRAYGSEEAWRWHSTGAEGYTIEPCEKEGHGTVITLHIKPSTDDENYEEYLDQYRLRSIVRNIPIISAILSAWTWRRAAPWRSPKAPARIPRWSLRPTPRPRPSTAWCPSGGKTRARSPTRSTTPSIRISSWIGRTPPG